MKWQDGINRGKDFHIQNPVHIISLLSHRKRSHAKSDIATSIQPIPFSTPRIVRIFPIVPNSSLKSPSKKYPIMTRASRVKIYLLAAKRKGRKIHFLRRHFVVLFLGRGRKLLPCLRQNMDEGWAAERASERRLTHISTQALLRRRRSLWCTRYRRRLIDLISYVGIIRLTLTIEGFLLSCMSWVSHCAVDKEEEVTQ